MKNTDILTNINRVVALDAAEAEFLETILISRPFKQGEVLVKDGDPARYLMFVNSGYLMTYYTAGDGGDHVVQFAASGWWCADMYAISEQAKTPYTTKGLGDGEVLLLPRPSLQLMLEKYPRFEKYFRVLFQNSVLKHQRRFIEGYSSSAEERYLVFVNNYPGIDQFVPQKYIASYLGMSPEFLSKTRAKLLRAKS